MTLLSCRAALLAALFPPVAVAQSPDNVLLIIADDVGVDGISCYGLGASPPPTPNVDALAQRGVRFTNAHSCPTCSPTRASLMTGRHGFRTGVGVALGIGDAGLAGNELLIPELLRPAGIRSALFGKWHLGDDLGAATPTGEGLDEFAGTIQGGVLDYYQWPKVTAGHYGISTTYSTTDIVDDAVAFVAAASGPWFLVVSFHAAHVPLDAPPATLHSQNLAGLDPQSTPVPFFEAMVEAMDSEIGRLLGALSPTTAARTNVVFLGDNGPAGLTVEPPFDPDRSKGTVYQGGVRVPLIVAGPAVQGTPRVESGLVHAVDLFPTLLAMQGVAAPVSTPAGPVDGVSFVPLLQAAGQPAVRDYVYTQQFVGAAAMTVAGDQEMIRDRTHELLRFRQPDGTVREELYDLANDPWEQSDLLALPATGAVRDVYRRLFGELAQLRGYPAALPYGNGCSGAGAVPVLAAIDAPVYGATFHMRVTGLAGASAATFGVLGLGDESWLGLPLPADLGAFGMPGCSALVEPLSVRLLAQSPLSANWPEPLPNDVGLVGLGFFAQALALVPGANAAGALTSAALQVVIGMP